ncbi:Translin-associated factor X-interacting protein 1 [Cichlidogyrus casuarinus]|uniref:Translin-associated factor X-interacting protein 1 n=1 Tax=Cichlidogyrus casuarinus TaxID=1844966 RepID=A0ABD2QLV6_9PLAT
MVPTTDPNTSKAQVIDPWPNHLKSRIQSQKVIHYSDEIDRIDCTRMIYKPELLQNIERKVIVKQLKMKQANSAGSAKELLMIYREAFAEFITECSFYKPILSDIKLAYETRILELEQEVQQIVPLQQLNTYICLNSEKKLAKLGEKEQKVSTMYEAKLADLQLKKEESENSLQEKDLVVQTVLKKVKELEKELGRAKESNDTLLQNITELQMHIYELENIDQKEVSGIEITKKNPTTKLIRAISLEQSQMRVRQLMKRLDKLREDKRSMVPVSALDGIEAKFEEKLLDLKQYKDDYYHLKDLNARLFERNEKLQILESIYEMYYTVISKVFNSKLDDVDKKDIIGKVTSKTGISVYSPDPAIMQKEFEINRDIFDLMLAKENIK